MRQIRNLLEIEPSNTIGGAQVESRPKLTTHVDGIEHDPDHVSSFPSGGLFLREPTREDSNHGAQRRAESSLLLELSVSGRFRRLAPVHTATRHCPPPAVWMTRRDEARQQQPLRL